MFKYLFLSGMLASSVLAANQMVDRPPQGSTLLYTEEGAQVEKRADGSKFIRATDGTTVEVRADGSKTIKKPDGTVVEVPKKN